MIIVLYILCAVVGIGLIIFLHELGHFVAAKKVGVRVERFAVGFDPPVRGCPLRFFSFKYGETEYILGVVPLGGYVKLAGESPLSPDLKGAPDELMSKKPGARAFVFAAGAIFNIISAFLFFIIAFSVGVNFTPPEIGGVEPGQPAWKAGLRTGDIVEEINGASILNYMELMQGVALRGDSEAVKFKIRRGEETLNVEIQPQWQEEDGIYRVGVAANPFQRVLEAPQEESVAAKAGLKEGDELIGVNLDGIKLVDLPIVTLLRAIRDFQVQHPLKRFRVQVRRDAETLWLDVQPEKDPAAEPLPQLGVLAGGATFIRDVRPDSEATKHLRPGEQVRAVNGTPITVLNWQRIGVEMRASEAVSKLDLLSFDGSSRTVSLPTEDLLQWLLRGDIYLGRASVVLKSLAKDGVLSENGLQAGDRVLAVASKPCFSLRQLKKITETAVSSEEGDKIAVRLRRAGEIVGAMIPKDVIPAFLASCRDDFPAVAHVVDGGPAATAGITPGSVLRTINGERLTKWEDLQNAVKSHKAGDTVQVSWETPQGEVKGTELVLGLAQHRHLSLPLKRNVKLVRAGVLESFSLGARLTVVTGKWVFMTLRSLIRSEISAKNLSGPVGIAHILTRVSEQGDFGYLLYILALISINLGILNLLPIPVLDGGHLLFLAIEKLKGTPVDIRIQDWATTVALLLILALAVFVTFNDIARIVG